MILNWFIVELELLAKEVNPSHLNNMKLWLSQLPCSSSLLWRQIYFNWLDEMVHLKAYHEHKTLFYSMVGLVEQDKVLKDIIQVCKHAREQSENCQKTAKAGSCVEEATLRLYLTHMDDNRVRSFLPHESMHVNLQRRGIG
ncbi:unnamed protein product [Linum tenue]|uniref:Uncharacterized protein n=1 Tax=Linum tenue TaxID=586396 RepID=A0AAV0P3C1_9ROSI|nr:unnamed protein product [Linum tenue]